MRTGVLTWVLGCVRDPILRPHGCGSCSGGAWGESRDPLRLGELVRRHRTAALSQEQLAERAGLSVRASAIWSAAPITLPGSKPCGCWPMPSASRTPTGQRCWRQPVLRSSQPTPQTTRTLARAAAARDAVGRSGARGGSGGRHGAPWRRPPPDPDRSRRGRQDPPRARSAQSRCGLRGRIASLTSHPSVIRSWCCPRLPTVSACAVPATAPSPTAGHLPGRATALAGTGQCRAGPGRRALPRRPSRPHPGYAFWRQVARGWR